MNTNLLKIAVCDDVAEERSHNTAIIKEFFKENAFDVLVDEFDSGEALLCANVSKYHLVFMDIFMDGINGMETAKKIIEKNSFVQIIFASTSTDFAVEAFEIDAFQYFVKPVSKERIFATLGKFLDHYFSVRSLHIKVGRMKQDVLLRDILYFEANGKKTRIHTKTETIEASMMLSEIEALLPRHEFLKPIRWALVSIREILSVPSDAIKLTDGTEIPISRGNRSNVLETLADWRLRHMNSRMRGR